MGKEQEEEEQVDVETVAQSLTDVEDETAQASETGRKIVVLLWHWKDSLGVDIGNLKNRQQVSERTTDGTKLKEQDAKNGHPA